MTRMRSRLCKAIMLLFPLLLLACHGTRPASLGARDGRLAPCPASPNCVSSQAPDDEHRIAPFPFTGPARDAMLRLKDIVRSFPRTSVVTDAGAYLHVEFTSLIFRFVDDVEFVADDAAKVIHVRSTSRLGRSDLGENRQRVERIHALWMATPPAR
jgi:uncharacterized protein (DUF1499 family)